MNVKNNKSRTFEAILSVCCVVFKLAHNGFIYELWRGLARTFLDKNWIWKIRRILQIVTDQAKGYIRCWHFVIFYSFIYFSSFIICIAFSVSFCPFDIEPRSIINLFIIFQLSSSKRISNRERVIPNIALFNFTLLILFLSIIGVAELFRLVNIP
jgi:hypothetical protein